MPTRPLSSERIRAHLHTMRLGRHIEVLAEIDSTNRYVLDQPRDAAIDGLVVLAERQTAGRGRRGRSWLCPTGAGILCTVGLEPDGPAGDASRLALLVPIALVDGIRAATGVPCEILWPNDIVHRGRKLGGVLIEGHTSAGSPPRFAIGFGINCLQHAGHFPPELRDTATSLDAECAEPIDRTHVLVAILEALERVLAGAATWSVETLCCAWRARAVGLGGRVTLEQDGRRFTGNLLDIDPTAALVVQLDEGGRRLFHPANTSILAYAP